MDLYAGLAYGSIPELGEYFHRAVSLSALTSVAESIDVQLQLARLLIQADRINDNQTLTDWFLSYRCLLRAGARTLVAFSS